MTNLAPPVVDTDGEFSADRRRADGTRTYWATSGGENGSVLRRWDERDGAWIEGRSMSAPGWLAAVAVDPELLTVRPDEVTSYTAADPNALLDLLVPEGDGDPGDVDWLAAAEQESLDHESEYNEGHIVRWATVNDEQLSFADSDPTPVAFIGGSELVGGTPLASFRWDNGWGCGNSELLGVRPGVAVATSWNESDGTVIKGFRFTAGEVGLASVRAAWEDFFSYYHLHQAVEAATDEAAADEYGIEASLEYYPLADADDGSAGSGQS